MDSSEGLSGMKSREVNRGRTEREIVPAESPSGPPDPAAGGPGAFEAAEADALDDASFNDFTPAELREFLAADHLESHADPGFKERLRRKLWDFIRERYGSSSDSS
jgi:hypothetical protein